VAGVHYGLAVRTAKLAVVRADGSLDVAPVWADLDGDQVVFITSADTVKGKAILRDPRVSLCWDDERPPFRFVRPSSTRSPRRTAGRSSWRSPAPAATGAKLRDAVGQPQSGDTLVIYKPGAGPPGP
jgi:hypothetical protein